MTDEAVELSIVIVNWNAGTPWPTASLRSSTSPPSTTVGDRAGRQRIATTEAWTPSTSTWPETTVVANTTNRGPGGRQQPGDRRGPGTRCPDQQPRRALSARGHRRADGRDGSASSRGRFVIATPLHDATARSRRASGDLPTLRDALLGRQASRAPASAATPTRASGGTAGPTTRSGSSGRGHEACYLVRRAADRRRWARRTSASRSTGRASTGPTACATRAGRSGSPQPPRSCTSGA